MSCCSRVSEGFLGFVWNVCLDNGSASRAVTFGMAAARYLTGYGILPVFIGCVASGIGSCVAQSAYLRGRVKQEVDIYWSDVAKPFAAILGCAALSCAAQSYYSDEGVSFIPVVATAMVQITKPVFIRIAHMGMSVNFCNVNKKIDCEVGLGKLSLLEAVAVGAGTTRRKALPGVECVDALFVRRLIARGADINGSSDRDWNSPLALACLTRRLPMVKLLTEQGANSNSERVLGSFLFEPNKETKKICAYLFDHGVNPNGNISRGRWWSRSSTGGSSSASTSFAPPRTYLDVVFWQDKERSMFNMASVFLDKGAVVTPKLEKDAEFQKFYASYKKSRFDLEKEPFLAEINFLFDELFLVKKLQEYYSTFYVGKG